MPPQDKPAVSFNLDNFERPDRVPPFVVEFGAVPYVFRDVQDVDYRELIIVLRAGQAGNPDPFIRAVVAEDDQEAFFANDLPPWRLQGLFEAYMQHYGINPGEAAGSPAS